MYTRTKRITWTAERVIALVLLTISIVMLFLPWLTISFNVMGQKITIEKIINYASMYEGYTTAEFEYKLRTGFADLSEDMAYEGIYMDPEKAMTTYKLIADSSISPIDAARISSFAGGLLRQFNSYLTRNAGDLYGTELLVASELKNAVGKITAASIFLWILVVAVLVTFLLGLYFLLTDRKFGLIPYLVSTALFLVIFSVITISVNNGLEKLGSIFAYEIMDVFSDIGIDISTAKSLKIFHVSAAGFLCVLLALGAFFMTFLEGSRVPKMSFLRPTAERKWTCTCGRVMDMSAAFCSTCGTRRPEPRRCPNCGATVENDAEFCVRCGTHLRRRTGAEVGGYSPSEPAREATKICPMCGNAIRETAANCSFCGFDFNGKKFWGTLVKPTDDDMR